MSSPDPAETAIRSLGMASGEAPVHRVAPGGLDARLTVLPGCAHAPPPQEPERFLDAATPFLAEKAAAPDRALAAAGA